MEPVVMATKKTQQNEQASASTFVEERAVAGLLVGNEQQEAPKVGGRYKVNGVWVNANGEPLEDQSED
jgi:hypothetical protein